MSFPRPQSVTKLDAALAATSDWDGVIYIAPEQADTPAVIADIIVQHQRLDQRVGQQPLLLSSPDIAGQRLIYAPLGTLERDYDDVRCYADATKQATEIARQAGMTKPLLLVMDCADREGYQHVIEVSYLAMCQALYQPLEARENDSFVSLETINQVGIYHARPVDLDWLVATEQGRRLARDLCGADPERMSPQRFVAFCQQAFSDTRVELTVRSDFQKLTTSHPLLAAVGRASSHIERHQPRVLRIHYRPPGKVERTVMLAGKGVVYDTGGADLKTDGHMAGMSRDKGGAAGVAGFMLSVAALQPEGLEVIAELGLVRNSVGADGFVADELITSHAGVRVRIGNTDAEGRLVLCDLLSHLREEALQREHVELFTVATLTGHAALAYGPYSALLDNGPARAHGVATCLAAEGDVWGEPAEVSRSRREDFRFVKGRSGAEHLLSSNNAASSATVRGHQFPMAFISEASGLAKHGLYSQQPLFYTHIDIAGSAVDGADWQHDKPSAAPVVALCARYLSKR